jgi:transposase
MPCCRRAALWNEYRKLHDFVVKLVARNQLCRRFMAIPGIGPVTALSFMTAIDNPSRFRRSRDVAAYFGLTSRRWQSGSSIDVQGWRSGSTTLPLRSSLRHADALQGKDKVKTWGLKRAKRGCHHKATVAAARKLVVIMHAMWTDGTLYMGDPDATEAAVQARAIEGSTSGQTRMTKMNAQRLQALAPLANAI